MPVVPQGNYSKTTTATKTALTAKTAAGGTKGTTATTAAKAAAAKKVAAAKPPVKQPVKVIKPVDPIKEPIKEPFAEEVVVAPVVPEAAPWTLEGDALYQAALGAGKSAFSFAQAQALADKQNQETAANQQRKSLDVNAAESRRRLAGNYAARGMAGGAAGALSMAEARANAEQVAARTSITDQLTALNNQYLQNFGDAGAAGYDWTGTLTGQQYKTQAAQAALEAQLARYGAV